MFRMDFPGCLTGALGLVALCGFSVGARADLPDADVGLLGEAQIIYGDVQDDNQQAVQPDPSQLYSTIPLSAPSIASAEATGTFLATPTPSLSVTASATALGDLRNNAYAYASGLGYLNYYFQIDGPDGTVPVQINAAGVGDSAERAACSSCLTSAHGGRTLARKPKAVQ